MIVLAAAALLSLSVAEAAEPKVYKWVDAEGVVHYGPEPPAEGPSETVRVWKGPTLAEPADEKPAEAPDPDAKPKTNSEAAAEQKRSNCEIARANLATLQSVTRVALAANPDREATPEEREAAVQRAQQQIGLYCGEDPN